jgi:hypothetical protein
MNRHTTHVNRSASTPAYYLGRSAAVWHTALRSRTRSRNRDRPSVDRTNGRAGGAGHPEGLS